MSKWETGDTVLEFSDKRRVFIDKRALKENQYIQVMSYRLANTAQWHIITDIKKRKIGIYNDGVQTDPVDVFGWGETDGWDIGKEIHQNECHFA